MVCTVFDSLKYGLVKISKTIVVLPLFAKMNMMVHGVAGLTMDDQKSQKISEMTMDDTMSTKNTEMTIDDHDRP